MKIIANNQRTYVGSVVICGKCRSVLLFEKPADYVIEGEKTISFTCPVCFRQDRQWRTDLDRVEKMWKLRKRLGHFITKEIDEHEFIRRCKSDFRKLQIQ